MLDTAEVIAFLPTTDPVRAREFFTDTLGLTLVEESPYALVFDAGGTMLRVTPIDHAVSQAGYTVLGWRVTDIVATVSGLATRGVDFLRYQGMEQDQLGIWTTPGGDRIAWFSDPEGNTLSLTEFARSRD